MIPGPLLLITLPLVFAPLIWLLRRWATLAGLLSAGVSLLMAWMAWRLPLDETVQLGGREVAMGETVSVLGRELELSQADRLDMVLIFLIAFVYDVTNLLGVFEQLNFEYRAKDVEICWLAWRGPARIVRITPGM